MKKENFFSYKTGFDEAMNNLDEVKLKMEEFKEVLKTN